MLALRRFLLVCVFLAVALAAPAPISPSRSGKWLSSQTQKLSLAAKSRLALHSTRLRGNIVKSLHKTDLPISATTIPSRHSLDAFRQTQNTVRRAHVFRPKEPKMSQPNVAVLPGWFIDHQSIQSKTASQANFPGLNTTSIPHSLLQNDRTLKSKIEQHAGRKAAPLGTSKNFVGLFSTSLPIANHMGLTGDICTSSSECADGRICTNEEITTCPAGEACICVPSDRPELCTSSADCSTAGEVCVQQIESTVCFSEEAATAGDIPIVDDGDISTAEDPEPDGGSGDGITGTSCSSSSECADGRTCFNTDGSTCSFGDTCVCLPADGPETCTSSADCSTVGEVCVQFNKSRVCFSEETATATNASIVGSDETPTTEDPDPSAGGGDGITGSICTSSSECAEGRICRSAGADTCPAGETCFCIPSDGPEPCTSSADCSTAGEVCVRKDESRECFSEESATTIGFPIVDDGSSGDDGDTSTTGDADSDADSESSGPGDSESGGSTPNPNGINIPSGGDDNDDEVCIDARALGHVSTNGLVFEKHAVSRVLCDENNSCATRGHMVVFRGHAMRMSTYCDSVGCKEAVMEVNSPRFNRGMRIESNTKGLEYTVLAARYDTQAEESLIRMAVRFGL